MTITIIYKILIVIVSYLLGAFPTGFVIYKFRTGGDIRNQGSGNVGGTNVTRTVGTSFGIITIIADVIKGFLPVLAVYFLYPEDLILLTIAIAAVILGHDYPVFLRFKGGKGISSSYGVIIGLCSFPFANNAVWLRILPAIIILSVWLIIFFTLRIVSVASLSAAIVVPLSFYFTKYPLAIVIAAISLFVLTFIAHRDNIKRLIKREEKKLKGRGPKWKLKSARAK
jgi:glycerol-3-phosphate acyltransferase PlsY